MFCSSQFVAYIHEHSITYMFKVYFNFQILTALCLWMKQKWVQM